MVGSMTQTNAVMYQQGGNVNKEERYQRSNMTAIIEDGMSKYKQTLKNIIEQKIEELYGGTRNNPKISRRDEESERACIEIWDSAIEEVLNIVREI